MESNTNTTETIEIARGLAQQGFAITPVAYGTKKPVLQNWPNIRITESELANYFGEKPTNLGVLLGGASGGLVDVDLDCQEAITIAPYLLPQTDAIFGREGSPRSHWLYFCVAGPETFRDPDRDPKDERATLVEIRSDGQQTVFPNSVHPSGESIRWDEQGTPIKVETQSLILAVEQLAAASLLARYWPKGARHEVSKALAGALLRGEWPEDKVSRFVKAICRAANDEEADARLSNVVSTAKKLADGKPTTGFPTLADYFTPTVLERLSTWLHLANDKDTRANGSDRSSDRKSMATALVELASEAELFHTPDDEPYAIIQRSTHREIWHLKSKGFKDWLAHRFHESEGKALSAQALNDALGTLSGIARFDGSTSEVYRRVAEHNGSLYLDLCDQEWRAVEITPQGWTVTQHPPVKFARTRGMLPLPEPSTSGDINLLQEFINITPEDWPLIYGWLLATYRPNAPFPILLLNGEQGSAKSTTSRMLRELIDPNKSPVRSAPRDNRDLMIAAQNSWVVAFDNISYLPDWLSDSLCRLSTGGGFATRELCTNLEEVLIDVRRPIILNGIEDIARRSDLLDRIVTINLPVISPEKRREESSLWPAFYNARPAILGGMLSAVSIALRNIGSTQLSSKPRMADFARWVTSSEGAASLPPDSFLKAYTRNREIVDDLAIDASPVAPAIIGLMEEREEWIGTATELLEELVDKVSLSTFTRHDWPKRANSLGGLIKRLAPNLRRHGVEVNQVRGTDKKGTRLIKLERVPNQSSETSNSETGDSDNLTSADDVSTNSV